MPKLKTRNHKVNKTVSKKRKNDEANSSTRSRFPDMRKRRKIQATNADKIARSGKREKIESGKKVDRENRSKETDKFQFRCRTNGIHKIRAQLYRKGGANLAGINSQLDKAGLSGILEVLITVVDHDIVSDLIMLYDLSNGLFDLGEGKFLGFCGEDVHRVYQLPKDEIEVTGQECDKDRLRLMLSELDLSGSSGGSVYLSDIKGCLLSCNDPRRFVKLFCMYAIGTLLAPTSNDMVDVSKFGECLVGDPINIRRYNWSGFVTRKLREGLAEHPSIYYASIE
ncbi:unnamed protein product [Linum trigynum]|uniref:Uncharacterized protein n=1 Tax=Linum trigynum TaxID=586398 RepID=A0AAV2GC23_9ROSI